jgi:hypothetical protein
VEFVAREVGTAFYPPLTAIGEERGGEVVAGIVFNCWTGRDIELTVACRRGALSRTLLRTAGAYVFGQLGCGRATFTTENRAVVGLAKRLNAQTEGRKRNLYGPGRHGIILGIMREDWKHG